MRRAGIDVGGTKCLGVVLDDSGAVLDEIRRPTSRRPDELIDALVALAGELAPFDSLGVGVPGLVTRGGVLRAAPHLIDVAELDVSSRLTSRLGIDVHVDNDATCATLAEWELGAAQGANDVVGVTLGTGIGGGIVADGRLLRGTNGFAGEFGHMVVDPDGLACPCGRRGCWERYASGGALGDQGREAVAGRTGERIAHLAGGDPAAIRGEHVQQAALDGDETALGVIDGFARWVALDDAALGHGYDSHSGFREAFSRHFGSAPGAARSCECITTTLIESPVGPLLVGAVDAGICLLEFTDRRMIEAQLETVRSRMNCALVPGDHSWFTPLRAELSEYFAGTRREFTLPLVAPGSEFQEAVWSQLRCIPYGVTISYEELAQRVGRPGAQRAVGTANGMNRISILIPCHRVVNKGGALGGYGGGLWRKKLLLGLEQGKSTEPDLGL